MADLSFIEKKTLQDLFEMGGGFVMDFSNKSFSEYVKELIESAKLPAMLGRIE